MSYVFSAKCKKKKSKYTCSKDSDDFTSTPFRFATIQDDMVPLQIHSIRNAME